MIMATLTAKEMAILHEAWVIKLKHAWLATHPGKTKRDWDVANRNHDSELQEWMLRIAAENINRELRNWLEDHPGKTAEDYEAVRNYAATDAEIKAMAEWRARRGSD
jgi:hypothetical protein